MNSAARALLVAALVFAALLCAFLVLREDSPLPPLVGSDPDLQRDEPEPEARPPAHTPRLPRSGGGANKGPAAAIAETPDADTESEQIPLPRGKGRLVVKVVDHSDTPRARVSVLLRSGRASGTLDTDKEGQVAFDRLAAGRYSFQVSGEGVPELVAAKEVLLAAGEKKTVTIRLSEFGKVLAGRVLDREGNPVEGIRIFARKQMFKVAEGDFVQADQAHLETVSAVEGAYRLEDLEVADYLLRTEATEEFPSARKIFRAGVETADLILELTREFEIFGSVTGTDETAIENARIVPIGQAARQGRTDADGRYSIFLALSDNKSTYALKVSSDGFKERQLHVFEAEIQQAETWELNVTLEPLERTAPVRGVVVDVDQRPVAHETVTIYSAALSGRHRATTDASGMFELGDVQVGDYRLWVYPRNGYTDFSLDPLTVTEAGLELRITLEPIATGSLSGRILDPVGDVVPGFRLWLRSRQALGNTMEVTSNSEGEFELENVPAGELIFETRSFPRLAVRGIEFDPENDSARATELVIDWGSSSLQGIVVDAAGQPIGGVNIALSWSAHFDDAQSSSVRHTVTDAAGTFTYSELAEVEHKLSASANGFQTGQSTVVPGDGGELRIQLQPKKERARK